ncbi:MAG: hypothetical protein JWO95_753, partial [Verrucomicrobiales bacterium]|nr:hypothetical protein [Verrucomicrobiales bacterium]
MTNRRQFLKSIALTSVVALPAAQTVSRAGRTTEVVATDSHDSRRYWLNVVEKLADPILTNLARRELRTNMPIEGKGPLERALRCTHLEAFARLLVGIAPWLECRGLSSTELKLQQRIAEQARIGLDAATDPQSADFMNFSKGGQALVDSAFLAQAFLRAPTALWEPLTDRVKAQTIAALKSSRAITPGPNNHLLFAALVEAALLKLGEPTLESRLEKYLRQMLAWYRGDGAYSDGEYFRFDYY